MALRLALAAGVIGLAGAALLVLAQRAQLQRDFERHIVASAGSVSALVRAGTRAGMLQNRWDDVQQVITDIERHPDVVLVRLLDKRGRVVLSSNRAEIGTVISRQAAQCAIIRLCRGSRL